MTQFVPVSLSVSLSPYTTHFFLSAALEKKWLAGKTRSRERQGCDEALFISSLAPQWLAQQCQRARSGSNISCTLSHTHTALFYLSGCCLLSIWLSSLCLSACPPHKPNNATLLRLLRLWPAAQWKKRRRTWGGGKGKKKWGKEKVTRGHGQCHAES